MSQRYSHLQNDSIYMICVVIVLYNDLIQKRIVGIIVNVHRTGLARTEEDLHWQGWRRRRGQESVDLPLHSSSATLHLRSRSRFGFHSSFSTFRILQSSAKYHLYSRSLLINFSLCKLNICNYLPRFIFFVPSFSSLSLQSSPLILQI